MDIKQTPYYPDIDPIINSKDSELLTAVNLTGVVHNVDEDYSLPIIVSLDLTRDYVQGVSDIIYLTARVPMGDYIRKIFKYRNNLEVTIWKKGIQLTGKKNKTLKSYKERFKAILPPEQNPLSEESDIDLFHHQDLNNEGFIDIRLQLVNLTIEPVRTITVGGIYRSLTNESLLKTIFGNALSNTKVKGKLSADKLHIYTLDNKEQRDHVVIPSHTPLMKIPQLIQKKHGGCYKGGIGHYIQNINEESIWFIYPVFDKQRFNKEKKKLIIYQVPTTTFDGMEKTYSFKNDLLTLINFGENKLKDTLDIEAIDSGIGFKKVLVDKMMDKSYTETKSGPIIDSKMLVMDLIHEEREDNNSFSFERKDPDINTYTESNVLMRKIVKQLTISWSNADSSYIYPGMPCQYKATRRGQKETWQGTVIGYQSFYKKVNDGDLKDASFIEHVALSLALFKLN